MKTIEKILKGGAVCIALLSVTFCAKENAGSGSGDGGKEKTPVYITDRANCFVVAPGAYVAIDPCKGNSKDNVDFDSVGLVWEDNTNLVTSVSSKDGKIVVAFAAEEEGNAVVCAMNGADTTWSWNFWVLSDIVKDIPVSDGTNSATFMDRNIGALSYSAYNEKSIGNVYQWGRKDPWAGLNYEGDLKKMYRFADEVTRDLQYLTAEVKNNISNAIAHPMTHYSQQYSVSPNGNYSWLSTEFNSTEIAAADTLWNNDGKKTIYDPCPAGYKVASQADWNIVKAYAATPADTTKIIDPSYVVPKEISDKWQEKYVYQYSKQVQFRGGWFGPLTIMVGGEISHTLGIAKNVQANQPTAEIWTANIDPNFKASKSNFRAYACVLNASWVTADNYLKMGNLNTASGLNLAHELPVRCVKE